MKLKQLFCRHEYVFECHSRMEGREMGAFASYMKTFYKFSRAYKCKYCQKRKDVMLNKNDHFQEMYDASKRFEKLDILRSEKFEIYFKTKYPDIYKSKKDRQKHHYVIYKEFLKIYDKIYYDFWCN